MEIETYFEHGAWRNAMVPGEDVGGPYGSRDQAVTDGRRLADAHQVAHVVRDEQGTVVMRDEDEADVRRTRELQHEVSPFT